MHIAAFETGSLGALAVVGSGIPLAVGAGLAFSCAAKTELLCPLLARAALIRETGMKA